MFEIWLRSGQKSDEITFVFRYPRETFVHAHDLPLTNRGFYKDERGNEILGVIGPVHPDRPLDATKWTDSEAKEIARVIYGVAANRCKVIRG
jgi:hypothetical protein